MNYSWTGEIDNNIHYTLRVDNINDNILLYNQRIKLNTDRGNNRQLLAFICMEI